MTISDRHVISDAKLTVGKGSQSTSVHSSKVAEQIEGYLELYWESAGSTTTSRTQGTLTTAYARLISETLVLQFRPLNTPHRDGCSPGSAPPD